MGDDGIGGDMLVEDGDHTFDSVLVKPVGGFIEQQGIRGHRQYGGKGHEPFFSPGELVGDAILKSFQAEHLKSVTDDLLGFLPALPQIERPEGHILRYRRAEQLIVRILEQQSDPRSDLPEILFPAANLAEDLDLPLGGLEQTHDDVEERRLAAAVGANDPNPLSR